MTTPNNGPAESGLRTGWFAVRCEQCRKYAPVMEENDLCQECNDFIATRTLTESQNHD